MFGQWSAIRFKPSVTTSVSPTFPSCAYMSLLRCAVRCCTACFYGYLRLAARVVSTPRLGTLNQPKHRIALCWWAFVLKKGWSRETIIKSPNGMIGSYKFARSSGYNSFIFTPKINTKILSIFFLFIILLNITNNPRIIYYLFLLFIFILRFSNGFL